MKMKASLCRASVVAMIDNGAGYNFVSNQLIFELGVDVDNSGGLHGVWVLVVECLARECVGSWR